MRPEIQSKSLEIAQLCAAFGVVRLEVFGSAASGAGFDPAVSDADFLVTFSPGEGGLIEFAEFKDALASMLGRPVDLIERAALEQSRNYIRRNRIFADAERLYG